MNKQAFVNAYHCYPILVAIPFLFKFLFQPRSISCSAENDSCSVKELLRVVAQPVPLNGLKGWWRRSFSLQYGHVVFPRFNAMLCKAAKAASSTTPQVHCYSKPLLDRQFEATIDWQGHFWSTFYNLHHSLHCKKWADHQTLSCSLVDSTVIPHYPLL